MTVKEIDYNTHVVFSGAHLSRGSSGIQR